MEKVNRKKLCIATLDPSSVGGVRSMSKFVYKNAERYFDLFLVYNILPGFRGNKEEATFLKDINKIPPKIKQEKFGGIKGFGIERVIPEVEFLNYILNINKWKEVIDSCDIYFAIGGSNNCALPFVLLKKKFCIWVASTLYEDRKDRINEEAFLRKIRNYVSLPVLLCDENIIFQNATRILAVSNYTKAKILEKYKIDEMKIEVTHCPVNAEEFYPIDYFEKKNDYLLFTGRLNDERKNISLLLEAFSKVVRICSNIKLILIGEEFNKKLQQLLEKLKIQDYVEVYGCMDYLQLLKYYQNAAAFVIPSFQEGLCISGLEALACGIPIISTRCGGPEDFVKNDYNGYLVENNDIQAMASTILNFLSFSHEKRKNLGENARNYILENYNEDKIWLQFLQCLNL